MKIVLLGFTVPAEVMEKVLAVDVHMPIQTHTFAWSIVEALRDAGVHVNLLTAQPLASYPGNPRVIVRGGRFSARGVEGRYLPFLNLAVLKHATRLASGAVIGISALRAWRPDALIVHGVHSPFLVLAVIFRPLLGITVVTILTDPPGVVLPSDGLLVTALKHLDRRVVRLLLRGHDGVIALTPALADHYAPGRPVLIMEGIVAELPEPPGELSPGARGGPFTVVYAGGLSTAYGVQRLVDAVRGLPDENVRLQLYGRGELEGWIGEIAAKDPRVGSPRFVARSEVLYEYAQADLLVQPRPIGQDFVRFSFPSKLMEYMASGTAVISTRLPGIPHDYENHLEWVDPDDTDGLRDAITRVLSLRAHERRERAARARDFIWRTRGRANQGRRIGEFIDGLTRTRDSRSPPS